MGKMFDPETKEYRDASVVLKKYNVEPIQLAAKEGLAMINGTQFISSLGAEALVRAENCVKVADIVGALSLEVLKGTPRAFDPKIHDARPHPGQILSAATVRSLLHSANSQNQDEQSTLYQSHVHCNRVQDSYTLRCIPQVHGVVHDTLKFVRSVLTTELNSATDNPMIFAEHRDSISGGNFHGEYPAKVLDFLGIAVHELSSISERRIERLVNPAISGLPAFLVEHGGLNSGFMIAHCTAASLVSENKVLCHPSSVDSISTSASKEDHVSMGGFSARKALQIVENVEKVLAIELLCACQGLDFLRPLRTTKRLENVYQLVRSSGVEKWDKDRVMYTDIEIAWRLIKDGKVVAAAFN
jgi:histidine ammonia-lyase